MEALTLHFLVAALASNRWCGCPLRKAAVGMAVLVGFGGACRILVVMGWGVGDGRPEVSVEKPSLICRCRDGAPNCSAVVVEPDGQEFAVAEVPPPSPEIIGRTRRMRAGPPNIYLVRIKKDV